MNPVTSSEMNLKLNKMFVLGIHSRQEIYIIKPFLKIHLILQQPANQILHKLFFNVGLITPGLTLTYSFYFFWKNG